jgi:hypothetical protein
MKVAVLGAGSWGTTVAAQLSVNAEAILWAREPEVVEAIRTRHENPVFLPGFTLPDVLRGPATSKKPWTVPTSSSLPCHHASIGRCSSWPDRTCHPASSWSA